MNRRGYTLVEMLIALVLVVTLMSAAWSLTSIYNRFLTAGRAQAVDHQIARSLFQLIEDDVSLVSLPVQSRQGRAGQLAADGSLPDQSAARDEFSLLRRSFFETADSESGQSNSRGDEFGDTESAAGDFGLFSGFMNELADQNLHLPPLAFTGTATELRMTVISVIDSRPQAVVGFGQLSAAAELSVDQMPLQPDVSRLVTVVYQFEAPGMTTDLDRRLPAGLHRIEVPTLQLRQLTSNSRFEQTESADRQDNNSQRSGSGDIDRFTLEALLTPVPEADQRPADETEALVEPRHEHIAEVVHFELEYFDGATWLSSWDSADVLPTAIRVRFGVVSADELTTIAVAYADAATPQQPTITSATNEPGDDPLARINPRRFERILVLSSQDPPQSTPFGDDDFEGTFP